MAPPQESRRRRVPADTSLDDLYDYAHAPARRDRRRANRDRIVIHGDCETLGQRWLASQERCRRRWRIPKWRATADEDGHYSFAMAL